MNFVNYFAIVGVGCLIQGCASTYKVPSGVPTATVVFATAGDYVRVQVFDDTSCKKSGNGNRLAYFFMNTADPHSGVAKEIEAAKPFVYSFVFPPGLGSIQVMGTCAATTVFQPDPKQRYKATFDIGTGQCTSMLYRITVDNNGNETLMEEPSAKRIYPSCVLSSIED